MRKSSRQSVVSRVGQFLGGLSMPTEPAERSRDQRGQDLRSAWINADRMIGICKF